MKLIKKIIITLGGFFLFPILLMFVAVIIAKDEAPVNIDIYFLFLDTFYLLFVPIPIAVIAIHYVTHRKKSMKEYV